MKKILIMFAYNGYKAGDPRELHFWKLVEVAKEASGDEEPVVILNADTKDKGQADAFLADQRTQNLNVQIAWSVDTCQMWLHGWGYIIDNFPLVDRIILLPGDIDMAANPKQFYSLLSGFINLSDPFEIIIGDFDLGDKFGSKFLIDQYGSYQLLANWFPKFTQTIFQIPLKRPRSEFLNVKKEVLRELLRQRKFAYEQTINLLLSAWDHEKNSWKYNVNTLSLGEIKDDSSHRHYIGALNQIERTERLIKLRWREIFKGKSNFYEDFRKLNRQSNATRESCEITIQTLLGIRQSGTAFI